MRAISILVSISILMVFFGFTDVSSAAGPGKKADPVPPKMTVDSDNNKIWDRPEAFGPVPSKLQAFGNKTCGADKKAVGYHPKAKDENGKAFPRGGFLCAPKSEK